MTLRDLLERVERATGPDRQIDRAIWYAIVQDNPPAGENDPTHAALYTASVDAALALIGRVLPGFGPVLWQTAEGNWSCHDHFAWSVPETRPTPALALCAALLAAKIEQEGSQ